MTRFWLSQLPGALDLGALDTVAASLGVALDRSLECADAEAFRGEATDPQLVARWLELLGQTDPHALVVVPSFYALVAQLAAVIAEDGRGVYVRAGLADCWGRLGLLVPGQPVGLGPVRATWLEQARERTDAFSRLGFVVVDASGLDEAGQSGAILAAFS